MLKPFWLGGIFIPVPIGLNRIVRIYPRRDHAYLTQKPWRAAFSICLPEQESATPTSNRSAPSFALLLNTATKSQRYWPPPKTRLSRRLNTQGNASELP